MNFYDKTAGKKALNVSVNSDLLAQARELKLNLSALTENALIEAVRAAKARDWQEQNAAAIESHNAFHEEHGHFADHVRSWRAGK